MQPTTNQSDMITNLKPRPWSTFNGNIGDVFVYKLALSDADRQTLEADLKSKFIRE